MMRMPLCMHFHQLLRIAVVHRGVGISAQLPDHGNEAVLHLNGRSNNLLGQIGRSSPLRMEGNGLTHADSSEQDQADGSHDDELHRIPQAEEDEEVGLDP